MVLVYKPKYLDGLFEKAEEDPEEDFHLSMALKENFLRPLWAKNLDQDVVDKWIDVIDELDSVHPLFEAIHKLPGWVYNRDQEAAESALDKFDEALESSRSEKWKTVTVLCIEQIVQLKNELGGYSPEKDLEKVPEVLQDFYSGEDVHLGNASRLIQLVIENPKSADNDTIEKVRSYCLKQAKILHDKEQYFQERSRLKEAYKLSKYLDKDFSDIESRIIDSWEKHFGGMAPEKSLSSFVLIGNALQECKSFATKSKIEEWKTKLQEIAPEVIDQMNVFKTKLEIKHSAIKNIVKKIGSIAEDETALFVLYSLVTSCPHVSYIDQEGDSRPKHISDMLPKIKMSEIGTSSSTDYKVEEEMFATFQETVFSTIFKELLNQQVLKKDDFLDFIKYFEGLEDEDLDFSSNIIDNMIEGKYIDSFHVGIPHFERVLLKMLNEKGEAIIALKEDGTITTMLGTLIDKLEEYCDSEYVNYLRYTYTERSGQNRRNLTSHGLVSYGQIDKRIVTSLLLDIMAVGYQLNSEKIKEELGEPKKLL